MRTFDRSERRSAATSLLLARIVYAFNWFNIGAVLPILGRQLPASTFELGLILGAFLLGAGVFQVPAGIAALRWGNRTVSIFALFLMAAFSLASAFSPNWIVLALLRFGAGAGASFFFAPALGLVTSFYPVGARGPVIGLYNAGFSIGSGAGLFGGALVGEWFGWPAALLVGGVLLLAVAILGLLKLPRPTLAPERREWRRIWNATTPVLRSRSIWALSVGTAGLWAAYYIAAQYFIDFTSSVHPGWSTALAAALPTVMIVLEIPGGPLGGWLGERAGEMQRQLLYWGIACGVGILLIPYVPILGLVALFAFLGFADGIVFAILYLLPSYLPETHGETLTLGVSFIDSIQIFLGSGLAIAFGYLAEVDGYTVAWWFAGGIALAPLTLLFWVGDRRERAASLAIPRPAVARPVRVPNRPR
ncbi:MAG TPA: MFS transporter [Thermoplasmata archaeon]|nr:MFS transporter [Thermoplasmata archaeon]